MGSQVKPHPYKLNELRHALHDCDVGDFAYVAFSRDLWAVIEIVQAGPGQVFAEIVAGCERCQNVIGLRRYFQRATNVKKLADMEVVALCAR